MEKIIKKYPQIYVHKKFSFASIKLAKGIEKKSYIKDGFIFCEDAKGKIIEVQVLNLGVLKNSKNIAI